MQKLKQDINIGHNLRRMRTAQKLSQEAITVKMDLLGYNICRAVYSQMERGIYNIRISELTALKKIFNCSYEDFFNGVEEKFDKMLEQLGK